MKHFTFNFKWLVMSLLLCIGSSAWGQTPTTLFLETFGSTSSTSTYSSYTGYSATTGMFTTSGNVNTHYSGDGSVGRNNYSGNGCSSDYTGASGNSGCYQQGVKNTEKTIIQISNIDIEGYTDLSLSFGAIGGSTSHVIDVSYKIDNGSETSLINNGSITNASWTLLSENITGTGTSLTLYFKHTPSKGWLVRLDDIKVTGVLASTDPSSDAAFTNTTPSINYPATKTYSQAATTAAGYTGTITYSMTANTAGATIDSSTGLVTVTQAGSVTVKATAPAITGFAKSEATYTLTVNDTRTENPGLAWSNASADVTYGANNNVFPTLTNTHNVPVTYSSTNEDAATIDANTGEITLKDVTATTSIRASFAGNDDYLEQTVSYTLNVKKGPFVIKDGVFDFVEAASADPFKDYGSGMTLSSDYTTTPKTWTAGNVVMVTSVTSGNGYRWWSADGTLRFYNGAKATFSVPNGYVITKIVTTGANFDSANPSGLSGTTWSGASNEVALSVTATRNIKTITITYTTATQEATLGSNGYTTFASPYSLDLTTAKLPSGVSAYKAAVEGTTVTFTEIDQTVPANTGILLKGEASATVNIPVAASGTAVADNAFEVNAAGATFTGDGDYYYFGLKKNTLTFALFDPSSVAIPANKAYLMVLKSSIPASAKSLNVVFDETTGISTLERIVIDNDAWYDLQGRRVAQPTKGIYIHNGKKVFIK